MSLRKMVGMEGGLSDLEFQIKPKTLVFEGTVIKQFSIYFEKGVQVVGSFNSGNKHHSKETLYKFKYQEPGIFRLKNLSHATYTWNFYSVNSSEPLEEYQDSVSVDLMRTIELYELQLHEKEREIQTSFKERNPNRKFILDIWNKVRREMRNSRTLLKCIFPKLNVHLQFQLDIKNSLDLEIERQENKPTKEMKRSRSQPLLKAQPDQNSTPKSKIADPLIIKDEHVTKLLDEVKGNNMKPEKIRSPLQEFLKSDIGPPAKKEIYEEDIQAVVKIKNPKGIQLGENHQQNSFQKDQKEKEANKLSPPTKKFSMLSDIIERSHEGSSSFGGPDRISSSDRYPDRKDFILPDRSLDDLEPKNKVTVDSPLLNKFKTLPHQNYDNRFLKTHSRDDLRRAQTAEKDTEKIEQNEYSSLEDGIQNGEDMKDTPEASGIKKSKGTSGDPYAKYIIMVALLIILGFVGQTWYKTNGKHQKKAKTIKTKTKAKA